MENFPNEKVEEDLKALAEESRPVRQRTPGTETN
jgi:hypothetical protein